MQIEQEILGSLKEQLTNVVTNKKVCVITSKNYQEKRKPYMVVLDIPSFQVVNVGLKDYKITLKIIVDFFIDDDKEGYFFNETRDQIQDYLEKEYLLTRKKLTNIHESIVGMFLDDVKCFVTQSSNRCEMYYSLISTSD